LVAYEIASRLQEAGEEVGLLTLFDSYPLAGRSDSKSEHEFSGERLLARQLKDLGYYDGSEPLHVSGALTLLRKAGDMLASLDEAQLNAVLETIQHNSRLAAGYTPRGFSGDMLLFTARDDDDPVLPADRWKPYVAGNVMVHDIDCDHAHMMRSEPLSKIGPVLARELTKRGV
jgi:nonribosomal peptide synthetase DhbF